MALGLQHISRNTLWCSPAPRDRQTINSMSNTSNKREEENSFRVPWTTWQRRCCET